MPFFLKVVDWLLNELTLRDVQSLSFWKWFCSSYWDKSHYKNYKALSFLGLTLQRALYRVLHSLEYSLLDLLNLWPVKAALCSFWGYRLWILTDLPLTIYFSFLQFSSSAASIAGFSSRVHRFWFQDSRYRSVSWLSDAQLYRWFGYGSDCHIETKDKLWGDR